MSDSSPDIAQLTAEATQLIILNRVTIAGTALIFYDYASTFSTEISEVWSSKFNGAQVLFFLSRYSYMVFTVLFSAESFTPNPSQTMCEVTSIIARVSIVMAQIGLCGILSLRTYAIYQKNPFVLCILGLFCASNVAVNISLGVLEKPVAYQGIFGGTCGQIGQSIIAISRFQMAGNLTSLIYDILVFSLTFGKTIRHTLEMRKIGLGNGMGYFILRDGAMYFLAKLLIGVVGTVVFFVPASGSVSPWLSVAVLISNPLTVILINRLVLNLRQVSHIQEENVPTLGHIITLHEPAFATNSILGNLGAPLRVGRDGDYDDDEIDEIGRDDAAEIAEEREIVDHGEIIEELRYSSDV